MRSGAREQPGVRFQLEPKLLPEGIKHQGRRGTLGKPANGARLGSLYGEVLQRFRIRNNDAAPVGCVKQLGQAKHDGGN